MIENRTVGYALAALELVPGSPCDLNPLLLNDVLWQALLEGRRSDVRGPLAEYLAATIDPARIEHWTEVVEAGVAADEYRAILLTDPDYPGLLREVWDAPPVLFRSVSQATHSAPAHAEPSIAIVGSRETSQAVLDDTFAVAATVASEAGARVISGLAAGVDAAAHRGALSVGGATTAVLGTGIESVFPEENRDLTRRIADDGVLISQFAPSAPRTGTTFLRRNHVIAGMASTMLIMDGRERSGSRYAVDQAIAYERKVLMWAPALADEPWAIEVVASGKGRLVESGDEVASHVEPSRL